MEFLFERQAMRGEPLPKTLDIADSCLYMALKNLYAMYRAGLITRKDAKTEKQRLVYNWETDKSKIEFLNRESETLREQIGKSAERYVNERTIEAADEMYCAFYKKGNINK